MTIYLKQSTASQEIPLGYFVDSTDGNTAETALTIANTDIKLWKTGATTLADKNSGGATHIAGGIYYAVLDATDTNTLGPLVVFVKVSGALAVRVECCVLASNVYDSLIGGGDLLDVNISQFGGTNGTFSAGRPEVNTSHIAGSAVSTSTAQIGVNVVNAGGTAWGSGAITAASIATGAIDADALAADAGTEIGTAVWATAARTLTAATNITSTGGSVPITAGGLVSSDVTAISTDTTAANNAESFFDGTGYAGTNNVIPTVTSVTNGVTVTTNNDKTGYALSSAGVDAIWDEALSGHQTVGTAGRALTLSGTILDETTATGTPTTTTLQLTAGSATDDFYNDLEIIPTTGTLAGQARIITDYTGATKTVTIDEPWTSAPSNGDGVIIRARHSHSIEQIKDGIRAELATELGRIDVAVSTRASQTSLDTLDDYVDTEVAAIKAKTDQLTFTTANRVDSQVFGMQADVITASAIATDAIGSNELAASAIAEIQNGLSTLGYADIRAAIGLASANLDTQLADLPTAAENADAVWDEVLSGHLGAGSTGEALNAAGAAGDPWTTALPGAYGAGSAGYIIGTNINATISSRASQTSVDTIDGIVDDILVDTGTTIPAQISALNNISAADVLAAGDIDGYSLEEAQKLQLAAMAGKVSGAATTSVTIRAADDSKARITATVDSDGNRSALTLDATG